MGRSAGPLPMTPEEPASADAAGEGGREVAATGSPVATGSPPGGDRLDHEIEITTTDVLCVAPIFLSWLWAFFGQPISPLLINAHPVILAMLRGSTASMIVCGAGVRVGTVPLWEAILAPLAILTLADPFLYWAGRRYGRAIFDYYSSLSDPMRRTIARGEASFARYGFWAILFSAFLPLAALFFIAAGESRMRIWKFALADVLSNLIWIGLIVSLGWALGQRGLDVADAIGHYGLILSIALMVFVAIAFVRQYRRTTRLMAAREAGGPDGRG